MTGVWPDALLVVGPLIGLWIATICIDVARAQRQEMLVESTDSSTPGPNEDL